MPKKIKRHNGPHRLQPRPSLRAPSRAPGLGGTVRAVPILPRRLEWPSQGVIALLSFLTLHGCCLNNGAMSIHLRPQGLHKAGMQVRSVWNLGSPSPGPPLPSPLTVPLTSHLGNSAGDTKDQDAAQALFYQGPQHLF